MPELAHTNEPTTCADESLDEGCQDGKCTCPCGIPCTCGGCCGCCTVYCGHAYDCEAVSPTPTREEMFAYFDDMLSSTRIAGWVRLDTRA